MQPEARSRRVCLVVDSPLRDLEGLTLVAWHLTRQGVQTYLVPMYDQGTAVLGLEPDAVIVNYARATNRDLLETYAGAGILVSVLDTEGGIVDSLEQYASSFARNGTARYIDQMLVWGPLQFDAFAAHSGLPAERLVLTGCPRMDFCSQPWRDTLQRPASVREPFVLVNMNFSLVNPRFSQSVRHELATTLHAGFSGWDATYVERLAEETGRAMRRMTDTVADLATALPSLHFVVRPHPFENPETYVAALGQLPNVEVRLEGAVMRWINHAAAVLHLNCGSAVEAALMGATPISLEWLNTEALLRNAPFPREISHLSNSFAETAALLAGVGHGHPITIPERPGESSLRAVQQWFHNRDGRAAERVSQAVVAAMALRTRVDRRRIRRAAVTGAQRRRPLRGVVDVLGKMFGGGAYRWFRNELASGSIARGTRKAKSFGADGVTAILGRLGTVGQFHAVARSVRWSESWIPGQARTSVAVDPVPPPRR